MSLSSLNAKLSAYCLDTTPLYKGEIFDKFYNESSYLRQKKIDRYKFQKDKCLSLGAEILLKYAFGKAGIDFDKESFEQNEFQKPSLVNNFSISLGENIYYNISHSNKRVMCVISDHPCGCDVEALGDADMKIAKRFFSEEEFKKISDYVDENSRCDTFYKIWTLRESFVKCTGLGLVMPFDCYSIMPDNESASLSLSDNAREILKLTDEKFVFRQYEINDGYKYSLCVTTKAGEEVEIDNEVEFVEIK